MTHGLLQQDPSLGFVLPKPAPSPQHAQRLDPKSLKPRPPRAHEPRPKP
jgi:hypothetical protein